MVYFTSKIDRKCNKMNYIMNSNYTVVRHRFLKFSNICSLIIGLLIVTTLLISCNKTNNSSNEEEVETATVVVEDVLNQDVQIGIKLIHPESLEFGEPMRYSLNETSEGIIITPHSRNLDAFTGGKRFEIPRVCGFVFGDGFECVEFLSFDAYIENNSDTPITLDELYIDVERSKLDDNPYLYMGTTEDVSNSMIIVNSGWADNGKMTLEYKLLKKGESFKGKYDFKKTYRLPDDGLIVNFTDDLIRLGYNWDYIKKTYGSDDEYIFSLGKDGDSDNPNSLYFPFEWEAEDEWSYVGFCRIYGRISFEKSDQIIEFQGKISLSTTGGFGAAFDYDDSFNAQLKTEGNNYKVRLPYVTTIQSNDAERVKFIVRCDKSSFHKLSLRMKDGDGNIYSSKDVSLHYMMPKYCDKDNGRRNGKVE